jgi:outer membrane lipoprotein-sorting protein
MRLVRRLASLPVLALSLLLSGCSYFLPTKRHLPVPITPPNVQTLTPDDLVKQINTRWETLNNLTATVEISATQTKSAEGTATDFPSCRGYILMQKPNSLRVFGTYFGVKIFDMASDGNNFTLFVPHNETAYKGTSVVTEKSPNPLLNLRPGFFLDSIVVRGLNENDEYMVTNETNTVEDAAKKHLYNEPEYILNVMRSKSGNEKLAERVITFHRDDMLPYEQTIYDGKGNLETQVSYSNYQIFSAGKYPSTVTIKRPQEGIQLVLSVVRVEENVKMGPDQFQLNIPEGTKIQVLK